MIQPVWGAWEDSWIWSILLAAVTAAIHATGIVLIARLTVRVWDRQHTRKSRFWSSMAGSIAIIVTVTLALASLHGIESLLWAVAYLRLGALSSPAGAALYSLDSMTTRGASGLFLAPHWRMMGAVEAADGMLLFGISTAFLFTIMARLLTSKVTSHAFQSGQAHRERDESTEE